MSNEHNNQAGARRPLDENALAHTINMMPWRTDELGPQLREFAVQLWLQFCSVPTSKECLKVAPAPAVADAEHRALKGIPCPTCSGRGDLGVPLDQTPAPAVPQGWKLVPVEPTPEMKAAGINIEVYSEVSDSIGALTWAEVDAIYRAMLAATPATPAAPSQPAVPFPGNVELAAFLRKLEHRITLTRDDQILLAHAADTVEAAPAAPSQEPAAWVPHLVDRADGVKGHYAIGRWNPRGFREVWNLHTHRWAAYSDDVMSLEEADSLLRQITIPTIAAAPSQEPVTLRDSYAGVIAWIGDKQCKLPVTEDAIKHEHTPGVAMRNAAHQCVQEVTAALREKGGA